LFCQAVLERIHLKVHPVAKLEPIRLKVHPAAKLEPIRLVAGNYPRWNL
jgi:hypothetical protein